jgi:hypothetical protein
MTRGPIWKRDWYRLTALFAIALLAVALQWNTSTLGSATLTPRSALRPVPENVQAGLECLGLASPSGARLIPPSQCQTLPATFQPGCIAASAPRTPSTCLLS